MRIALTVLLVLHGVIHLMGFLKWSQLAAVPQLSGRTLFPFSSTGDRVFSVFWLVATLVLLAVAILWILRHEAWWTLGMGGVILSQCLIVLAWHDAKFGSIANVLILVPIIFAATRGPADAVISQSQGLVP